MQPDPKPFGGIVPPLITPLLPDESLDEEGLACLVQYQLSNHVHGLFALGSSGEGAVVGRNVWRRATEIILREAKGTVPVYCCAIECGTARVIEDLKELEQMGAHIACAVPPFYMIHFSPPEDVQSQVLRHFEHIAGATDLKLLVYGMSSGTHVNITTDTMIDISEMDHVIGFKDTRPEWGTHLHNIIRLRNTGVCMFSGGEEMATASLAAGAHGNIAALTNVFPKLFVDLYDAVRSGNMAAANDLQRRVLEIKQAIGSSTWLSGLKYAAVRKGLIRTDTVCVPMAPLPAEDRMRLDSVLEKYG